MPTPYQSIALMPKQYEFVMSDALQILYSGAVRAGKSRALCYRAIRKATPPKSKVGLCRKTLVALKQTTLRTLLEADGDLPPVLPAGSYTFLQSPGKERIALNGGGEIIPFGCDNPEKVGSLTLSDLCIDEGIELDEPEWNMLTTRCSLEFTMPDGSKNKRTMATATNPGPPTHFLHRLFFEEKHPSHVRHLIKTSSLDNWHLPKDYIELNLAHLPGAAKLRYLYGIWAAFEGAIYPQFARGVHEYHDPGPWEYHVAGVDYGFTHRTSVRVHAVRRQGLKRPMSHVVAEYYEPNITRSDLTEMCVEVALQYQGISFVVDPAAPDIIEELRRRGLSAKPAVNDVIPGIRCVGSALTDVVDGRPRLTFETGLAGTEEYMSYSWKPGCINETPSKKKDDACDADRYAMMEVDASGKIGRLLVAGQASPAELYLQEFEAMANIRRPVTVDVSDDRWWSGN